MEQAFGLTGRQKVHNRPAASRLAHDGDIRRVSTKRGNILLHPFQCRNLIHQTIVPGQTVRALGHQVRMHDPAEHTKPVIDRDEHDTPLGIGGAIIDRLRSATDAKRPAMDPQDHRSAFGIRRCPDVQ